MMSSYPLSPGLGLEGHFAFKKMHFCLYVATHQQPFYSTCIAKFSAESTAAGAVRHILEQ